MPIYRQSIGSSIVVAKEDGHIIRRNTLVRPEQPVVIGFSCKCEQECELLRRVTGERR
jgi:hypothetical protein